MTVEDQLTTQINLEVLSQNYLSLIQIESDYITPESGFKWADEIYSVLSNFANQVLHYLSDPQKIEAVQTINKDIETLVRLSFLAQKHNYDIPVVFEGYHLSNDNSSATLDLLNEFIGMIQESGGINLSDNDEVAAYASLMKTSEKLTELVENKTLWNEYEKQFTKAREMRAKPSAS